MTTTEQKSLTITLTDRPPVRITKTDWPIIATARGDSYGSGDLACHDQAVARGECDQYRLTVRQHAAGRAIVYGVLDAATAWTGSEDYRGGELLPSVAGGRREGDMAHRSDIAAAIRRVGESCHLPDSITRECIADLPAVEI
jgi:hypothetical protein